MEQQMNLIKKAKRGDTHAFALLYGEVYQELYRTALYILKNSHDAEDAVSDTVADAWAQIGSLRKDGSFRAWIFTILTNKCRRKLKEYTDKTVELPRDLCAQTADADETLDVRKAFSNLEKEDRLILALNIFGGYSSREIGEMLQMNANTVRSRQKRALAKLQAQLQPDGEKEREDGRKKDI